MPFLRSTRGVIVEGGLGLGVFDAKPAGVFAFAIYLLRFAGSFFYSSVVSLLAGLGSKSLKKASQQAQLFQFD